MAREPKRIKGVIYVAAQEKAYQVQGEMEPYRGEVLVGVLEGLGTNPAYITDLSNMLLGNPESVDLIVFDFASMCDALGGGLAALTALMDAGRHGLGKSFDSVVLDEGGQIRDDRDGTGRLERMGFRMARRVGDISPEFKRAYVMVDPTRQEATMHVPGSTLPTVGGGEALAGEREVRHARDPFAGVGGSRGGDVFANLGVADAPPEPSGQGGRREANRIWDGGADLASDPFAGAQQIPVPGPSVNEFLNIDEVPQDVIEERYWQGQYAEHEVPADLEGLAKVALREAPQWDYSQLNAELGGGGRLSLLRRGRAQDSGVSPSSLANSLYIQERMRTGDGYYSAPKDCKVITVFSGSGGTGKTTVAGMVAVQLNWYFNPDVMQRNSSSWKARVLILSLNEFDDLSVKGIGYDNPMGSVSDRKNAAELLKRIDECNGSPEWDDVSDCFAASQENYVYYLPSVTLQERLESGIELTAADYKKILAACSKFFGFIVIDMPDVIYDHKEGLVEWALNTADVVVYVMQPDTKGTYTLYQILRGLRNPDGTTAIDRDKWMVVINKYAQKDSPYLGYIDDLEAFDHRSFEEIRGAVQSYFFDIQAIPLTSPRGKGNILFGRDPNVKKAARDITDSILRQIDINDEARGAMR